MLHRRPLYDRRYDEVAGHDVEWTLTTTRSAYSVVTLATMLFGALTAAPQAINKCSSKKSTRLATDVSHLTSDVARDLLQSDWERLDKNAHAQPSPGIFGESNSSPNPPPQWNELELTPPLPNTWPPTKVRSVSYYAYGQFQDAAFHGPTLTFSAPWARVILVDGRSPSKQILRDVIGPAIGGRASRPLSPDEWKRLSKIYQDGAEELPALLSWTELPVGPDKSVMAIRRYYCRWIADESPLVSEYIKPNHREFFSWLRCDKLHTDEYGIFK